MGSSDPEKTHFQSDELGVSFDVYRSSIDGKVVVHVETEEEKLPCNDEGPTGLRIYMNDDTEGPLWDN